MLGIEHYIITVPDNRLRQYWPEADFETSNKTLEQMFEMSRKGATDGRSLAGLSSVQVNLPGRVVTVATNHNTWWGFINPLVIKRSYQHITEKEGCFSLPKIIVAVNRPYEIEVEHTDRWANRRRARVKLTGTTARFALHEIDHINGILITDYQIQRSY